MKQLLRRLGLMVSLAAALFTLQLAVPTSAAYAIYDDDWPRLQNSGICEDGMDPDVETSPCQFVVRFDSVIRTDRYFDATTIDGTAFADQDFVALSRLRVQVPAGSQTATIVVRIVNDGRCERPETFTLRLSGGTLGRGIVDGERVITDAAC